MSVNIWSKVADDIEAGSVNHRPFQECTYKPGTLDPVLNGPGRILVRRKGLRTNAGRGIVTGLLVLGVLFAYFNFAGRDNWLERVFDGTQAMSLVTSLIIATIYLWSKTLASTLDWLRGVTEVTDEESLCRVLGASSDEVKIAT